MININKSRKLEHIEVKTSLKHVFLNEVPLDRSNFITENQVLSSLVFTILMDGGPGFPSLIPTDVV